ncbi:tetraacyldisaccharide 4'-kinase [Candidatus Magnetominusculus xianensis]|uniref:Tetraacyldisaccharide 4'-kinase n=1 Tax=Candidatus Magnetominusculus xianensis TaxID=1748249 RepID=A0ABR5SFS4_9BACT|nr:tetraacyldisaccharide 4'-kinase [Candidatus Magnetominusculus xianensis]KWT86802.1 tetraacyldisaccharide 4'-kinase [Candidatus Magnetominusculus xianensis]MBF0402480.1 tetraacyldisaccharide 4'-kinase [Nitrospirota bacterium]
MNALQYIYYSAFRWKKQRALKRRGRLPHPVVSIGNLTVGGTGKTPAAVVLAKEAQRRGLTPVILTRGYKGTIKGPCFVSRGNGPILTAKEGGDEPVLMANRLPGVEIIKGSNRYEAGLLSERGDFFILDDGFQHWGLHRDVDIVLIDGINPFGSGGLLPTGRLRQPIEALKRADFIVKTKMLISTKEPYTPGYLINGTAIPPPASSGFIYGAAHTPSQLLGLDGTTYPLSHISGRRVLAFCAIGNPAGFSQTLFSLGSSLGAEIVQMTAFRDHHYYTDADALKIRKTAEAYRAELILTTEKDLLKLPKIMSDALALCIDFTIDAGFYDEVFTLALSKQMSNIIYSK